MTCFVTHLGCANCFERYDASLVHGLCVKCQRPLWVRCDLDAVGRHVTKRSLAERENTMWRYRELLPVRDAANIITLGEAVTPPLSTPRLAAYFGVQELCVHAARHIGDQCEGMLVGGRQDLLRQRADQRLRTNRPSSRSIGTESESHPHPP